MPLTPEQVQAYVANGASECPHCHSGNIVEAHYDAKSRKVFQQVHCQDCGSVWSDEYTLSGVAMIEEPQSTFDLDPNDTLDDQPHDDEGPEPISYEEDDSMGSYSRHVEGN